MGSQLEETYAKGWLEILYLLNSAFIKEVCILSYTVKITYFGNKFAKFP
jgi:hypothetical protein